MVSLAMPLAETSPIDWPRACMARRTWVLDNTYLPITFLLHKQCLSIVHDISKSHANDSSARCVKTINQQHLHKA